MSPTFVEKSKLHVKSVLVRPMSSRPVWATENTRTASKDNSFKKKKKNRCFGENWFLEACETSLPNSTLISNGIEDSKLIGYPLPCALRLVGTAISCLNRWPRTASGSRKWRHHWAPGKRHWPNEGRKDVKPAAGTPQGGGNAAASEGGLARPTEPPQGELATLQAQALARDSRLH